MRLRAKPRDKTCLQSCRGHPPTAAISPLASTSAKARISPSRLPHLVRWQAQWGPLPQVPRNLRLGPRPPSHSDPRSRPRSRPRSPIRTHPPLRHRSLLQGRPKPQPQVLDHRQLPPHPQTLDQSSRRHPHTHHHRRPDHLRLPARAAKWKPTTWPKTPITSSGPPPSPLPAAPGICGVPSSASAPWPASPTPTRTASATP
jgi:hypothetical protein